MELIGAAVAAGEAHIADRDKPDSPPEGLETECGWYALPAPHEQNGDGKKYVTYRSRGVCVGWLDGDDDLYLEKEVSYRTAQRMAVDGSGIETSGFTLLRHLKARGLLRSIDLSQGTLYVRPSIGGKRERCIHVAPSTIGLLEREN
jgi:hypothetical protein